MKWIDFNMSLDFYTNIRNISCCFTGHRKIENQLIPYINNALLNQIEYLIINGFRYFYCGGAVGFDTLAEKAVIKLRKKYPDVKLIIAVPHRGQSNYFKASEKQEYHELLSQADIVIYLSSHYYNGCMHMRNRFMVDRSSYCICYLTKNIGGTAYTIKYAEKQGLDIVLLPDTF